MPRHGRYLTLRIPETQQAPRHYAISSAPLQGNTLDIAVRREEGGVYSNYIHNVLKEGDKVLLGAPMGLFCNPDGYTGNIAFVVGGIGASPIVSFLRQCVLLAQPAAHPRLVFTSMRMRAG